MLCQLPHERKRNLSFPSLQTAQVLSLYRNLPRAFPPLPLLYNMHPLPPHLESLELGWNRGVYTIRMYEKELPSSVEVQHTQ